MQRAAFRPSSHPPPWLYWGTTCSICAWDETLSAGLSRWDTDRGTSETYTGSCKFHHSFISERQPANPSYLPLWGVLYEVSEVGHGHSDLPLSWDSHHVHNSGGWILGVQWKVLNWVAFSFDSMGTVTFPEVSSHTLLLSLRSHYSHQAFQNLFKIWDFLANLIIGFASDSQFG